MNSFYNCYSPDECRDFPTSFPPQHQKEQPGLQYIMNPQPFSECCRPVRKLENKAALVTGGDSGIGRAVAYDFVIFFLLFDPVCTPLHEKGKFHH